MQLAQRTGLFITIAHVVHPIKLYLKALLLVTSLMLKPGILFVTDLSVSLFFLYLSLD